MMIKCPECGTEISDQAKVCPKCGCPIMDKIENQERKRKSCVRDFIIAGIIILILIMICKAYAAYFNRKEDIRREIAQESINVHTYIQDKENL